MTETSPPNSPRLPRWPWAMLAFGLLWTAAIRIPLILNAADHLDSDLAVDGLTLIDATRGRWRWHYPGTPYMGIIPVLASFFQAMFLGADPTTLVSGGTLMWILAVLAIFGLARRAFGTETAGWALVPLVFSSLGTIWLSGRITGGHLLTLAWHAAAFSMLASCLTRPSSRNLAILGVWSGLGLYLDTMFLFTLIGLASTAVISWSFAGCPRPSVRLSAIFLGAFAAGFIPGVVGRVVDPYDAYPDQFRPLWQADVVRKHAAILGLECLPRLIAGTEVSTLRQDLAPWGRTLPDQLGDLLLHPGRGRTMVAADLVGFAMTMALSLVAVVWLVFDAGPARDPARRSIRLGLLFSSAAILAAFVVNRNIFNSDNYRYLVFLIVPWSLGFGMFARWLAGRSRRGRYAAIAIAAWFAIVMTAMTWSWYRTRRGYLEGLATPVSRAGQPWSRPRVGGRGPGSGRATTVEVPDEVTHLIGDYWDVYRVAFLSGGRVTGVPYPMYPNRFRGWSKGLEPGRGALMVLTPFEGWKDALGTLWEREGRDASELDRLNYVLPH